MEFRSFWQNKSWQYKSAPGAARWRLSQCVVTGLIALLLVSGASAEPLLDAAASGDIREVKLYLARGADVNVKDADSFRPLHWAAFGGYKEMVELLVTSGAAIEVKNVDGLTPLHTAVLAGHPEVVKHLIAVGANTAATTRNGNTAREMAVIRGRTAIVNIFDEQPVLARYQTVAAKDEPVPVASSPKAVKPKPVAVSSSSSPAATAAGEQPPQVASLPATAPPSPSEQKAARLPAVVKAPLPAPTTPPGRFLIQLASVRSESAAEHMWARYQKSFPDLLGANELLIERIDLAKKGVFYRVRTGPFTDREQAEAVCHHLKDRKKACLIIRH